MLPRMPGATGPPAGFRHEIALGQCPDDTRTTPEDVLADVLRTHPPAP